MRRMTLGISAAALIWASAGLAADDNQAVQPETRAEAQARAEHLFDKLDLDHDGKLDQADRAARTGAKFDRLDANHDGVIAKGEFAESREHEGPDHSGMAGEHPGAHMGHWGYDRRELDGLIMLVLHRADPGHTGTVPRAAFVSAALSLFDEADTDHDGVLTPAEHQAFAQAMQAKWQVHHGEHYGEHYGEHRGGSGGDMPAPH